MLKKLLTCVIVIVFILSLIPQSRVLANSEYDSKPAFHDVNNMTGAELAAEMRQIIKIKQAGKYYPPERINAVEKGLVDSQVKEMKKFEQDLKDEAAQAKIYEKIKEKIYEKVEKEAEKQYEKNEEKIKEMAEAEIKRQIGADKYEKAKEMYEKGSEYYDEKVSSYVEKAQKAYDIYNKYQEGKSSHPDAPETARNLLGFLAGAGDVMTEIGDKLEKSPTPLKIVGQVLQAYGQAAGLGDKAATNAWNAVHGTDAINIQHNTDFTKGMEELGIQTEMYRTPLNMFNNGIRIFEIKDGPNQGKYAAFDENGKVIPGPSGNAMTPDEYQKMQQGFAAWQNNKEKGWPDLTTADLVKLAKGEKINVKTGGVWPFNTTKDFNLEDIMNRANDAMSKDNRDTLLKEIEKSIKDSLGFMDKLGWGITNGGRGEITKSYRDFLDALYKTDPDAIWKSDIDNMTAYKNFIDKMIKEGKSWAQIKDAIKKLKDEAKDKKDKNDPAKDKVKGALGLPTKGGAATPGKGHWTGKNPDEFTGTKDNGFSGVGKTPKPLPDPFQLGIPVLKPNIYLYPTETTDIEVSFKVPYRVTTSIPYYQPESGWKVNAQPGGKLDGIYDYLFYEADVPTQYFQTTEGWRVSAANRNEEFGRILDAYGFNKQEKVDFIEFWSSRLDASQNYLIYPQETARINAAMPMNVSPTPINSYRIWFYFFPGDGSSIITPSQIEKIERNGYTLVEWGGMVAE